MATPSTVTRLGHSGVGVDIGGSFAKLVYFRPLTPVELPSYVLKEATTLSLKADIHLSINSDQLGGVIRFIRMPVGRVEAFSSFIKETGVHNLFNMKDTLNVTGGGAFKFEKMLKERLNVAINKLDEMRMLVNGLNFVLSHVEKEVFTYSHETKKQTFVPPQDEEDMFPYLLVNIGSGVSILKVSSRDQFQRVSGSSIGGGTFWGLACQMAGVTTWDEVAEMSVSGDNRNIDLLVGDIYGSSYEKLGLDANVIASSMGKAGFRAEGLEDAIMVNPDPNCVSVQLNAKTGDGLEPMTPGKKTSASDHDSPSNHIPAGSGPVHSSNSNASSSPVAIGSPSTRKSVSTPLSSSPRAARSPSTSSNAPEDENSFKNADIVKSLLFMICNNIGQVAFLNAKLHQVKRVYFAGGFIQRNPYIWSTLSFAIKFWSKGDMEAMFLVHDGYLGALGALLADPPTDSTA
jgi:type II pantothenate kinase